MINGKGTQNVAGFVAEGSGLHEIYGMPRRYQIQYASTCGAKVSISCDFSPTSSHLPAQACTAFLSCSRVPYCAVEIPAFLR
jgi:hypothetical protein